jgi:hypothetical protein
MKVLSFALLAFLAKTEYVSAFVPGGLNGRQTTPRRAVAVDMSTETDVSVPYDAAARLSYDNWRDEYLKGEFDPVRYESFKDNYEAITIINVSAKKKAREEGSDSPSLLALNEYADYTAEEYEALMKDEEPSTTGDILGQAVEAAESQMAASSALQDAADALAEEEEVCFMSAVEYTCRNMIFNIGRLSHFRLLL